MATQDFQPFSYLIAEKAAFYRAIMQAFVDAKERFALHLRPSEIIGILQADSARLNQPENEIDTALSQLCVWGNLEAHPDTSDVATVEEFYRPRFLYQMTSKGEAIERAVAVYFDSFERKGELQTAALADVLELMTELVALLRADLPDDGKIHRTLLGLRSRFEELTERAQIFMRDLQGYLQLDASNLNAFLEYKELLIGYLERFIRELVLMSAEIAARLEEIDRLGALNRLLQIAADRDLTDALVSDPSEHEKALRRWRIRWAGLRAWFIGAHGMPSQSEVLRAKARSAVPALLALVHRINESRAARSDRSADFRKLAVWFAECDSDTQAHRLWLAAFGLAPSRHLSIDQETLTQRDLAPVSANTSWLNAPPVRISPRLRLTGSYSRKGRASAVVDRRREKSLLTQSVQEETRQILEAHARLARGQRLRISDLHQLSAVEFELFLDLLGEALSWRINPRESIEASSSDGSLRIVLQPPTDGSPPVTLTTSHGVFSGPDHYVTIWRSGLPLEAGEPLKTERSL